jgi:hypothetical protein
MVAAACGMVKEVHEHKREVVVISDQPHVPWVRQFE